MLLNLCTHKQLILVTGIAQCESGYLPVRWVLYLAKQQCH